jgi:hypothetical protein
MRWGQYIILTAQRQLPFFSPRGLRALRLSERFRSPHHLQSKNQRSTAGPGPKARFRKAIKPVFPGRESGPEAMTCKGQHRSILLKHIGAYSGSLASKPGRRTCCNLTSFSADAITSALRTNPSCALMPAAGTSTSAVDHCANDQFKIATGPVSMFLHRLRYARLRIPNSLDLIGCGHPM